MDRVVMDIVTCGDNYIEVNAWLRSGSDLPRPSLPRQRTGEKTSDVQQRYNDRKSAALCRQLIKTNFSSGEDSFFTLTFGRGDCPATYDELLYVMKKFTKSVQRYCDKHELIYRWLFVVELTAKGRCHVHMLMNGDIPADIVETVWREYGGRIHRRRIGYSTKDLDTLAAYIQKQPAGRHGFHYSKKTLQMPVRERDEKLLEPGLFKSLAYESHFAKTDVADVMERLFPGFRMVMDADDREFCGWIDECMRTPYMFVELERIRDDRARQQQYERLSRLEQKRAYQQQKSRPVRDAEYWRQMAEEQREWEKEMRREWIRTHKSPVPRFYGQGYREICILPGFAPTEDFR